MRRPGLPAIASALAVAGATLFILLQLQPGLLVASTTPTGGDMGAHVWGPAFLRDHLLHHGRISGWSPDWYAGFPAYHFYFPLPSLLIVLLDVALPYAVAFKLVTVSGLVALPAAAWAFGRLTRLPFPTPPLFAVATVPFVFDRFHTIWGGNAAATLAGEFSFSIALALALLFLGVLDRALRTGRGGGLAAVLLATTFLCHLLPAAMASVGGLVVLCARRPQWRRWVLGATIGVLGVAVCAFWLVPFLARLPYSNDMGWERTNAYVENLFPFLRDDQGASKAMTRHLLVVFPLAAVGAAAAIVRLRRGGIIVTAITVLAGVAFLLVPAGPIWNARLLPFWYLGAYLLAAIGVSEAAIAVHEALGGEPRLPRAASAPSPWLTDHAAGVPLLDGATTDGGAAAGAGAPHGRAAHDGEPPGEPRERFARARRHALVPVLATVGALLLVVVVVGRPLGVFATGRVELPFDQALRVPTLDPGPDQSFVPSWARWNYTGYERKPDYPEYREVVTTMASVGRDLGCGRAMWEYEPELNRFGTPMALMLLPYWTDGCIGSMEGLFFESSATVPYHFLLQSELSKKPSRAMRSLPYRDLDVAAGVAHMKLLGVEYYLAISPEAQEQAARTPELELVATTASRQLTYDGGVESRHWQVYRVRGSDLVEPLAFEPVVVERGVRSKHGWLDAAVDWFQDESRWDVPLADDGPPEWRRVETAETTAPRTPVRPARVSGVEASDNRISFEVDRVGSPVLVRASYFPNWKVTGARGPYRVTPNLMVVVPTANEVSLHYGRTPVDLLGLLLSVAGLAGVLVLARRSPVPLPSPPQPPERFDDPFVVAAEEEREPVLTPPDPIR